MFVLTGTDNEPKIEEIPEENIGGMLFWSYGNVSKQELKSTANAYLVLHNGKISSPLVNLDPEEIRGYDVANVLDMIRLTYPSTYVLLDNIVADTEKMDFIGYIYRLSDMHPVGNIKQFLRHSKLREYID